MAVNNYSVKTFGCKVNTYDSALIQKSLHRATGRRRACGGKGKVHIVNTCAVTDEAVKEARRYILRHRRQNPDDRIVVTGCAAQVETEKFSTLPEVDLVVANSHKEKLAQIVSAKWDQESSRPGKDHKHKIFKSSIFKKTHLGEGGGVEQGHTRLFLKIQDGCDSFCTFCIIPFARGKSLSLPPQDLIRSIQTHYDQGVREVVLTGVHIGDYCFPHDPKKGLADLVRMILQKTSMPRIRLSSLEPPELTPALLELFADPRMCPHFHLSIQSAHSAVLKQMKRHYTAQEVESAFTKIHKQLPTAFVGMDLIAGFAGETKQQFEETYLRLKGLPWTKIHVFPYSPRKYTYAQKMYPSHPRHLIMKRAGFLRRLSDNRLRGEKEKQIGQLKMLLPLKYKNPTGLSRDYWTVLLRPARPLKKQERKSPSSFNEEIPVRITAVDKDTGHLQGAFTRSICKGHLQGACAWSEG